MFDIKKFVIIIFLFYSEISNAKIVNNIAIKIDNKIITNLDVAAEVKYLKALNPNLKSLNKDKIFEVAKNSLIREKIKY